jgi:hypothetical protein
MDQHEATWQEPRELFDELIYALCGIERGINNPTGEVPKLHPPDSHLKESIEAAKKSRALFEKARDQVQHSIPYEDRFAEIPVMA